MAVPGHDQVDAPGLEETRERAKADEAEPVKAAVTENRADIVGASVPGLKIRRSVQRASHFAAQMRPRGHGFRRPSRSITSRVRGLNGTGISASRK